MSTLHKVIILPALLFFTASAYSQTTYKWLHYDETKGYNHNTRSQSFAMFEDFADWLTLNTPDTYIVIQDSDGSEFENLANLQTHDLIIFSNTSGHKGLSDNAEANVEQWVQGGGNYLGIHAASDTYRHSTANGGTKGDWDWYAENLAGATVQQNPNHTSSNKVADIIRVNQAQLPSGHNYYGGQTIGGTTFDMIPDPWNKQEEYYYWENGYLDSKFTSFLDVEPTGSSSKDQQRMVAQFYENQYGGCMTYTSLGHDKRNFTGVWNNSGGSASDTLFRLLIFNMVTSPCGAAPVFNISEDLLATVPGVSHPTLNLIWHDTETGDIHLVNWTEISEKLINKAYLYEVTTGRLVHTQEVQWQSGKDMFKIPGYLPQGSYILRFNGGSPRYKKLQVQ